MNNKFKDFIKLPLIVGTIAAILFIVDSFIGGLFVDGAGFMWVAFVSWTVFFGVSLKERAQALIGNVIGFLAAVAMIYLGKVFTLNILSVSIASVIAVFLINALVMFFQHGKKYWIHSISGIFVGIFLTFSGLGVGLAPNSVKDSFLMLGIILTYGILGLACGYFTILLNTKKTNKEQK